MSRRPGLTTAILTLAMVALSPDIAAQDAPAAALACGGCHGSAPDSAIPRLGGQPSADMVSAMEAFRSGAREATVMGRIAKGFSDAEIRAIADWYAREGAK